MPILGCLSLPGLGACKVLGNRLPLLGSSSSYLRLLPLDLLPPEVCSLLNPAAIYANNEISLHDVEVYGFDYDYTLAQYADSLHPEIFTAARDILIEHYKVSLARPSVSGPGGWPGRWLNQSPEATAQPAGLAVPLAQAGPAFP